MSAWFTVVIWAALALATQAHVSVVHDTLEEYSPNTIVVDSVVPTYRYFGALKGSIDQLKVYVFTGDEQEEFCRYAITGGENGAPYFEDTLVLLDGSIDLTCAGALGNWRDLDFPAKICTKLSRVVVLTYSKKTWNGHPGDYFESLYEENAELRNCLYLETELDTFREEGFWDDVLQDPTRFTVLVQVNTENPGLRIATSGFSQFMIRGVVSTYVMYVLLRAVFIWRGTHHLIQKAIVGTVICQLLAILVLAIHGLHFVNDGLPFLVVLMFQYYLPSVCVAVDFMISIYWMELRNLFSMPVTVQDIWKRHKRMLSSGLSVICFDIMSKILCALAPIPVFMTLQFYIVPSLVFLFQLIILLRLRVQLAGHVEKAAYANERLPFETVEAFHKQIYQILISVRSSIMGQYSKGILFLIITICNLFETIIISEDIWLLTFFFLGIATCFIALNQIKSCSTPASSVLIPYVNRGKQSNSV